MPVFSSGDQLVVFSKPLSFNFETKRGRELRSQLRIIISSKEGDDGRATDTSESSAWCGQLG